MPRMKFDGVIEAVHYHPDGQVAWVRVYERRGSTFSDVVLLDRDTLVDRLKAGKKFTGGRRIPLRASTFEFFQPVRLFRQAGKELLVAGESQLEHDSLAGIPTL